MSRLRTRARSRGGGASGGGLAVLYNGGKEVHDGSGHMPRNGAGFYVSRTTGQLLRVDPGFLEGDAIDGGQRVHGLYSADGRAVPAVGSLSTQRRAGFSTVNDTNYIAFALDNSGGSAFVFTDVDATASVQKALLFGVGPDPRWGLSTISHTNVQCQINGSPSATAAINAGLTGGNAYMMAGTCTAGGTVAVYAWDDAATLINSDTATGGASGDKSGPYYGGRAKGVGFSWASAGTIHVIAGWDGDALDAATLQDVADAVDAGVDVDTLRETYGAAMFSDGVTLGMFDAASPLELFSITGSGADVTVAAA